MIFLIKSFIFFSMSFFILSFQYDGKSLFYIIQNITGPVGANIQKSITSNFNSKFEKSEHIVTGLPARKVNTSTKPSKKPENKQLDRLNDGDKKTLNNFLNKAAK